MTVSFNNFLKKNTFLVVICQGLKNGNNISNIKLTH